jgi:hypothetical protein
MRVSKLSSIAPSTHFHVIYAGDYDDDDENMTNDVRIPPIHNTKLSVKVF